MWGLGRWVGGVNWWSVDDETSFFLFSNFVYTSSISMILIFFWVLGRKEILDGMLGANLVCFQVSKFILFYFPFIFYPIPLFHHSFFCNAVFFLNLLMLMLMPYFIDNNFKKNRHTRIVVIFYRLVSECVGMKRILMG